MSHTEEGTPEDGAYPPVRIAPLPPLPKPREDDGKRHHYSVKRHHTRTYQTLLTGSKVRHLKKKDGEPLWRKDIQYDFLNYIFSDEHAVFTNRYTGEGGNTFATLYIDAMARSSKCSRVLALKLLGDREMALNIAKVCLLVNIGRVNTTLNFFPEMKAQLRTYHAIPSLQAGGDSSDYKQLQDAPRLKSILKGACEDQPEPSSLEEMTANGKKPRTNPINLVFLMSTYSARVQQRFFMPEHYELFDLVMNKNLSSKSRGRAFLWLLWAYLETDLSVKELQDNPFGEGQHGGTKIPPLDYMTDEEAALENVDTEEEIEFGEQMRQLRLYYIEESGQQAKKKLSELPGASRSLRQRASIDYAETPDGAGTAGAGGDGADDDKGSATPKPKGSRKSRASDVHGNGTPGASSVRKSRKSAKGRGGLAATSAAPLRDLKFIKREWARVRAKGSTLYDSDAENIVPRVRKLGKRSEKAHDQYEYESGVARAQRRSSRWLAKWPRLPADDATSLMGGLV